MRQFLILMIFGVLISSCQDVIDVDLNTAPPRLVIEANFNIIKDGGAPYKSFVRLTTTTSFYGEEIPIVNDAIITITDENGDVDAFSYWEDGIYRAPFDPQENIDYTLQIIYKEEVYTATTHLVTTASIEYIEQRNDGGFDGKQVDLKAYFTDPIDEENFYYFVATSERGTRRSVTNDAFFNGNTTFLSYQAEDLATGDDVLFHLYGVTEEFHDFMFILLQQTGGGGPFEAQPATVRGNIINETNRDNYPFGYFRISEVSLFNYKVE